MSEKNNRKRVFLDLEADLNQPKRRIRLQLDGSERNETVTKSIRLNIEPDKISPSTPSSSPSDLSFIVAKYHSDYVKTNEGLQKLLDLIHKAIDEAGGLHSSLPPTNYLFRKFLDIDLTKKYSFTTDCCKKVIHDFKSMSTINCPSCSKSFSQYEVINQANCSVR